MYLPEKDRRPAGVMQLRSAVLCVDCESVINNRTDKCPVCGSQSVFSIAPMLGGSIARGQALKLPDGDRFKFDVQVRIELRQVGGKEVNAVVDGISESIRHALGPNRASLHVNVEPVEDACGEERAA